MHSEFVRTEYKTVMCVQKKILGGSFGLSSNHKIKGLNYFFLPAIIKPQCEKQVLVVIVIVNSVIRILNLTAFLDQSHTDK